MFTAPLQAEALARYPPVGRGFYQRPTATVARDLVGRLLLRERGGEQVAVRLTETEAYTGPEDPACHTAGGRRTERVRSMWGPPGHTYVYLIYGLHHCLNLVTGEGGAGEAVLLRGGVVVHGLGAVRRRRGPRVRDRHLTDGPGKLCQALAVDRADDGLDVTTADGGIWVVDDGTRPRQVVATPRVGIDFAGAAAAWPLRFVVR